MLKRILALLVVTICCGAAPLAAAQQRAPLDWFVGYDTHRDATMSPNGRYIAVLRRDNVGDTLIVVDMETRQSRGIQRARADQSLEITGVRFLSDQRVMFTLLQKNRVVFTRGSAVRRASVDDGFEWNSRIYAVNTDGSNLIALYDPSAQQGLPREIDAAFVSRLPNDPDHVLLIVPAIGGAELRKVNVHDATFERVDQGTLFTFNWVVDSEGTPVLRQDIIAGGRGYAWLRRAPGTRDWVEVTRFRGAEGANSGPTFQPVGAALRPGQVFILARRDGFDTSGLYVYDTASGEFVETVQTNERFDISNAIRDTENNSILAACWWAYRWTCEPKDPEFGARWTSINNAVGNDVNVRLLARSEDNNRWLISVDGPQNLGAYYIYNHQNHSLNAILQARPGTNPAMLPTQHVVEYAASDGMQQWGYLWLPPGVRSIAEARNLPTIVVPHGGPEGRDVWGFDPFAISFASQGYAVFQPNFRGGGGFGRRFVEAGHGQWGQRMQQDVVDGARYLVTRGISDPNRMCINGWSYGGYVAFSASYLNTDTFRCSVAGAGVSDLRAMLRWVRAGTSENDVVSGGGGGSQSISYQYWTDAIGEPGRDGERLDQFSAARNAASVGMPLLIIHGDEDQTVPIEQSELMVRAMERAGKPTRLVVLHDIDHYATPIQGEAWTTVLTEALAFFNQHIGPGVPPPSAPQAQQ
ncbi:MAG: S9 family peptidase [Hyphomonadaceae bacterium]|nr:S9 family peptidase [Hyphomonadaceae bacterium]